MFVRAFFAVAATLISVSSPAAAAETTRTIQTIQDADYFGFDLRTEQNLTLDQCKSSCIGDKSCKAFTYNPKVKWCFLKSDFKTMNPFPGAIAGKIVETSAAKKEPDIGAAPRLTFLSGDVIQQARDDKSNLEVADDQQSQSADSLIANGRLDLTSGNAIDAVKSFRSALALSANDAALWLETARAADSFVKTDDNNGSDLYGQAVLAAVNGYELTRTTTSRAEALAVLAAALEKNANYRAALNAYKASLALVGSKDVQAAFLQLKATQGFRMTEHTVDADSANPRACATFSETLVKTIDYTAFVTLNGAAPKALETNDKQICIEGLAHGENYKIAFRTGLPSSVDEVLEAPVSLDIYVKDRTASVRFTGTVSSCLRPFVAGSRSFRSTWLPPISSSIALAIAVSRRF